MTQDLVSVCIPVYNAGSYIEATINSVMGQIYENIEIIIVDDGSTDNSFSIAEKYSNDRIRIFSQPNLGASSARNKCLAEAKGQYIQFLDADDLLSADKIQEQVNILREHPGMVAVCSTIHFDDKKNHLDYRPSAYEELFLISSDPFSFLINLYGGFSDNGSMIQPNAWLTPTDIIQKSGPWNEELTLDDDGEYFCRVLLNSAGVIKSKGYNYYRKYNAIKNNLSALKESQHLHSQYLSLNQKIFNLRAYNSSFNLDKIQARWLYDLRFRAYPCYPDLVVKINQDLKDLRFTYTPRYPFSTLTGRVLNMVFGWKLAKRLQLLKHLIKSW
jgi:glycosyltransferase involved in cell wall biosynthesis